MVPTPRPPHSRSPSDRKSTRLNSSHSQISYAVFCLKKKKAQSRDDVGRHVLSPVNIQFREPAVSVIEIIKPLLYKRRIHCTLFTDLPRECEQMWLG